MASISAGLAVDTQELRTRCEHEQVCKKLLPLQRCSILRVSRQTWFCGVRPMLPRDLKGQSSESVVDVTGLAV